MNTYEFSSVLVDNIQLRVRSLETLLYETKQCNHNSESDLSISICNDIHEYIRTILTDCQRIVNNYKFNLFSIEDHKIQNKHSM